MRIIVVLALFSFGGCASSPNQCVNVPSKWVEAAAPNVGAEIVLIDGLSASRKFNVEESTAYWYRHLDDSYFICLPGWEKEGCGQTLYKLMKIDNEWQGVFYDGVLCTG